MGAKMFVSDKSFFVLLNKAKSEWYFRGKPLEVGDNIPLYKNGAKIGVCEVRELNAEADTVGMKCRLEE